MGRPGEACAYVHGSCINTVLQRSYYSEKGFMCAAVAHHHCHLRFCLVWLWRVLSNSFCPFCLVQLVLSCRRALAFTLVPACAVLSGPVLSYYFLVFSSFVLSNGSAAIDLQSFAYDLHVFCFRVALTPRGQNRGFQNMSLTT